MPRLVHPAAHLLVLATEPELVPPRQSWVVAHVAECGACRRRLAHLQSAIADVRGACHDRVDPDTITLATSRQRLRDAMRAADAQSNVGPWSGPLQRLRRAPMDIAAMAGASVLALWLLWNTSSSDAVSMKTVTRSGTLPVSPLTPGAVSPLTGAQLCAGERPSRLVDADVRHLVLQRYGMDAAAPEQYELDALITPELGGTTAPENLWPQLYKSLLWNAYVKDALEQHLAAQVCRQEITLEQAQRAIAHNWVEAYRRVFATSRPLPEHAARTIPDDDLIFEPVTPVRALARRFGIGPVPPYVDRWERAPSLRKTL